MRIRSFATAALALPLCLGLGVTAYLQQPGNPTGTVVDALTNAPISGADVTFRSRRMSSDPQNSVRDQTTNTGTDGRFEIEPEGTARGIVEVQAPGFVTLKQRWPSKRSPQLMFELTRPAGLHGRLVDATSGKPVRGIISLMIAHPKNPTTYSTKSDENGAFAFQGLLAGKGVLAARAEGMAPETRDVDAVAGQLREIAVIPLQPSAIVEGMVIDPSGNRLSGARINVQYRVNTRDNGLVEGFIGGRVVSGGDGTFRIVGVVPGRDVTITATAGGRTSPHVNLRPVSGTNSAGVLSVP